MVEPCKRWSYVTRESHFINPSICYKYKEFLNGYGFKLVSSENFRPKEFFEYSDESCSNSATTKQLIDCLDRLADDYRDISIYEIGVNHRKFFISYLDGEGDAHEEAICFKGEIGTKLVFEAKRKHGDGVDRFIAEYVEDAVFGEILRIWMHYYGHTDVLTLLEDGRIIIMTQDEETADKWQAQGHDELKAWFEHEERYGAGNKA